MERMSCEFEHPMDQLVLIITGWYMHMTPPIWIAYRYLSESKP